MAEFTEGVGAGGPFVLKDGVVLSFDAIMVELKVAHAAMQELVDQMDAGQVRSNYTYEKFKGIVGD